MLIRRQEQFRTCAVCERTILQGERSARYSPGGDEWVEVCPLCIEVANERGWAKEGSPTTPLVADEPRRRRRRLGGLAGLLESRAPAPDPVVPEPVLRRLSPEEQHLVEAAELFNKSPYSRTIAGVAKSLGEARVSMVPRTGTIPEIVITIAWEISWYQYRVVFESAQPVRLEARGQDVAEVAERFTHWNATFDPESLLRPDIPRF